MRLEMLRKEIIMVRVLGPYLPSRSQVLPTVPWGWALKPLLGHLGTHWAPLLLICWSC